MLSANLQGNCEDTRAGKYYVSHLELPGGSVGCINAIMDDVDDEQEQYLDMQISRHAFKISGGNFVNFYPVVFFLSLPFCTAD